MLLSYTLAVFVVDIAAVVVDVSVVVNIAVVVDVVDVLVVGEVVGVDCSIGGVLLNISSMSRS